MPATRPIAMPGDDLLARTRRALDAWETAGGGPTSSITGAGAVTELERRAAAACGTRHALALPSGTLALRVALEAVGVEHRTNVVVPALDWPAAAAATLSLGATPRTADVAAGSLLVDPAAVARRIDARTRAVVVTHVAGLIVDVEQIGAICRRRGVALIEDACQALGAQRAGRPVGRFGDAGIVSLGPGKLLDAGEAGVLLTNDAGLLRTAVAASQHPVRQLRSGIEPRQLGLTCRVHPLAAILACAGFETLDEALARRRGFAQALAERVSGLSHVRIPAERPGDRFAWPCVPAILDPRGSAELASTGVDAEPIGFERIARLVDDDAPTPNADDVHRHAVRLLARAAPVDGEGGIRTRDGA